jgi:hypothetical protein
MAFRALATAGFAVLMLCSALPAAAQALAATALGTTQESNTGPWHVSLQLGTTALATNHVIPVPLAIGAGVLIERGMFGMEAAVHLDGAIVCDNMCGSLLLWDAAPRWTPLADDAFSPYIAVRFQLADTMNNGYVPALGPRLGARYRGEIFGFYAEGGASVVSAKDGAFGQFLSNRRWFPQVSAGLSITVW